MASGRRSGDRRGGRPSAADLARRDALVEEWRPAFAVGEAHFRARRRLHAALDEMAAALDHVAQLGTFDPIEIARQRQRLSFLGRDMRQTHPRGVLADSATVIAEYHPQYKTWDEAEGAVLALCDNHGVRGAGDPNVLAEADGMRGVKAFKKKRRTLEKKLGGRVVTGSRARRSE